MFLFFLVYVRYSLFSLLLLLLIVVVGSCLVTEKILYREKKKNIGGGILRIGIYVLQSIKQVGED